MRSKIIAISVAVLIATVALAAPLNFSWTNATTNTDGTAIPSTGAGSLTNTIVEYGPCNADKTALASVTASITTAAPRTTPSVLPPDVGPGTWCGHARHTNTYGEQSGWSNTGSRVVAAPVPSAPTNFSMGQ